MEVNTLLEEIGLTKNEIKIYFALLELGRTTTGKIIKKTGIHTSKVYEGLERLSDKGVVTHVIISNTKHFNAVNPLRLIDFLEEKKKKIDIQEQELKSFLPFLMVHRDTDDETEAEIFQGWKGMETVYKMLRDNMKKGEFNYVFGASKGEDEEKVRDFFNKHMKEIARKKIRQKVIFNESARGNIKESYIHPKLCETRHLKNTTPAEINIWHDNVMVVILTKKPAVVLIKNKKVADSFRQYFEVMWKQAKP